MTSARPDYLAHLRADSARFAAVLVDTDPATPVPTCPGWTAADLLWHLGEVQHFWGTIVRDRLQDVAGYAEPERPEGYDALLAFALSAAATLTDALGATPDDVAVWTWFDADRTTGFVRRRQAHEALIHRLDAELTAGAVTDLDADLATDGVLEALEWMYGGAPEWASVQHDGPVGRVATTDTGATWTVRTGHWSGTSPNSGTTYDRKAGFWLLPADGSAPEPGFEVRGTARDLDAWLWNRPTVAEVVSTGDAGVFREVVSSGVQ